jgi:hypothetical protein
MNGVIAIASWEDCDTCKHGDKVTGACELENEITLSLDIFGDEIICEDYEAQS